MYILSPCFVRIYPQNYKIMLCKISRKISHALLKYQQKSPNVAFHTHPVGREAILTQYWPIQTVKHCYIVLASYVALQLAIKLHRMSWEM